MRPMCRRHRRFVKVLMFRNRQKLFLGPLVKKREFLHRERMAQERQNHL